MEKQKDAMMKTLASLTLGGSLTEESPYIDDPHFVFLLLLDDGVGQLAVDQTHCRQGRHTYKSSFSGISWRFRFYLFNFIGGNN